MTTISKLQVFDPAMCCPTGVCGPSLDTSLVRFASDLEHVKGLGIQVERYNLSQEPWVFAANETVRSALQADPDCLPLILADGKAIAQGAYPGTRTELLRLLGIEPPAQDEGETAAGCCDPAAGCC